MSGLLPRVAEVLMNLCTCVIMLSHFGPESAWVSTEQGENMGKRIAFVGAGALGGYVGGYFAQQGAVDELGGEGRHLVADAAAGGRQGQAGAAHRVRSARQRARRAPLEELMPGTWRA